MAVLSADTLSAGKRAEQYRGGPGEGLRIDTCVNDRNRVGRSLGATDHLVEDKPSIPGDSYGSCESLGCLR